MVRSTARGLPQRGKVLLTMATQKSTNTTPTRQMGPAEMSGLARRLQARADSVLLRDQPEQQSDMRAAARLIERLLRTSTDILVNIVGEDGTTKRSVPLREAIGDDDVEYDDCRKTLLADGRCTTGGGAAPLYHLTLAGTEELARLRAEIRRAADSTEDESTERYLRELLGGA